MKKLVNESLKDYRLNEKAYSEDQQQAAGIALSAKRGEIPVSDLEDPAKSMYDSMTKDELEDFAETEHEGLPEDKPNNESFNESKFFKNYDKEKRKIQYRLDIEDRIHRILNVPGDIELDDHFENGEQLGQALLDNVSSFLATNLIFNIWHETKSPFYTDAKYYIYRETFHDRLTGKL